jgi:serine/threonine-protein kinase
MGVVYRARQVQADRVVALKLIKGAIVDSRQRERFATEARALARARHPHIVQIYDVGEEAGCPYFSMEFVAGGSLAEKARRDRPPPREAARLTALLAGAVEAAHRAGVLHRDLKPANVLLERDGTPKLTDFGLAKQFDRDEGQTPSGAVLGTPGYMAPEQAAGDTRAVGPTTDVYGLGAILYELLTGAPPFRGPTQLDTLRLVLTAEPAPPSRSAPGLSRELEAVCLKCLEKDPSRRYPSAAALADDLERWLRGESTVARPLRWPTRAWRKLRRRPALSAGAVLLLVLGVGAAVAAYYLDPEQPRRALEARLAKGGVVTLIGPTGPPRWSRWRLREGGVGDPEVRDGTYTFQTVPLTLLELVTDPQQDRYRFSAELRHNRAGDLSFVGVYFGHRRAHTADGGAGHLFYLFRFDDLVGAGGPTKPPGQRRNSAEVFCYVASVPADGLDRSANVALGNKPIPGAGVKPRPWRKLVVTVTPERVRASFFADSETAIPVAEVAGGELTREAAGLCEGMEVRSHLDPAWRPRLPLGIYAYNGSVSCRNVTVTPLSGDE